MEKAIKPVVLVGGPRTGTSLTMQYLAASGLETGAEAKRSPLHEGLIRDRFEKPVLKAGGYDQFAQSSLPPVGWQPGPGQPEDLIAHRLDILNLFNWDSPDDPFTVPWGFKTIKGLLLSSYLKRLFPEGIKFIMVHREMESWVDSLMRTGFMNAHKTREGWRGYCERIQLRQNFLIDTLEEPYEMYAFFPSDFRCHPEVRDPSLLALTKYAGTRWCSTASDVFNPNLYKV